MSIESIPLSGLRFYQDLAPLGDVCTICAASEFGRRTHERNRKSTSHSG
jgi:hypothetical protein